MIMDERTEFADAVSVAAGAGTANIGDQIPLSDLRDIGNGQPIYLVITTATEIITGGDPGTIQFRLCSDDTASIHATTSTVHWVSPAFVTDDSANNSPQLNAGGLIACVPLPLEGPEYEEFIGIQAIIATETVTAGAINAFLTLDPSKWQAYPEGAN